jgi:hypothetical protein
MKKLDTKSAAVFTNLLKEESYPHFEARSVLSRFMNTAAEFLSSFFISMGSPCYCRFTSPLFTQ